MSMNVEGTILSELRHSQGTSTVQPTSNPGEAEQLAKESQVQKAELPPALPLPEELAFDLYTPSFSEKNEVKEDPLEVARLNNQSQSMKESQEVVDEVEYNHGRVGPLAEMLAEQESNSATAKAEKVERYNSTIVDKVSATKLKRESLTEQKYGTSEAAVQVHGSVPQVDKMEQERDGLTIEPSADVQPAIVTPLQEYQAHPLHHQTGVEVIETLAERESLYLHPEEEIQLMEPPERPLVPEEPAVESIHKPTYGEVSVWEEQAEQRFQDGVMENLQVKAQAQAEVLSSPAETAPVDTAPVEIEAQPTVDTSGTNVQEAVAQASQNRSENPAVEARQQNIQLSITETAISQGQSRENAGLTGERNSAQSQGGDDSRGELRSTAEVYAQEATQNVNYEPIPVETAEDVAPREVPSQVQEYQGIDFDSTAEPVAEQVDFEPQVIEVEGIDPEFLVDMAEEGRTSPSELTEEYVPPVFQEVETAENPLLEETEYFAPLPGSAEPTIAQEAYQDMGNDTVSETAIAEATESSYEMPEEYSYVDTIPEPSREEVPIEHEISHEQLAYLRNNPSTAEYTPDILKENETPVDIYGEPALEVVEEQWVPQALNMETNIRFSTNIGTAEVNLEQFEEVYTLPDTFDFESYDYNLVANRVVEAAMANAPQELYDTFVG